MKSETADDEPQPQSTEQCRYQRSVRQAWAVGGWWKFVRCKRRARYAGYCRQHAYLSHDGQVALMEAHRDP